MPGPEGGLRVVVGRHRVLRVLEREGVPWNPPPVVAAADVARVRRRYNAAFFGLPTIILGESLLARADRSDQDVFHADMVSAILRTRFGVKAFIPTYAPNPLDAVTRSALSPEIVRSAQMEYDDAAAQLGREGYTVVRIPFADHPVRNPVNVARFRDLKSGEPYVLLGRYPSSSPATPGGAAPLADLEDAFADLDRSVTSWRAAPSNATWAATERSLERTFRAFDDAAAASNPPFEEPVGSTREKALASFRSTSSRRAKVACTASSFGEGRTPVPDPPTAALPREGQPGSARPEPLEDADR